HSLEYRCESSRRMSNPKPHWNPTFAGVPLVLTFVNELAAIGYECQNRDTSGAEGTGQGGPKGSGKIEECPHLTSRGSIARRAHLPRSHQCPSALALSAANHATRHQRLDLAHGIAKFGEHLGGVLAEFRRQVPQARLAALHADR